MQILEPARVDRSLGRSPVLNYRTRDLRASARADGDQLPLAFFRPETLVRTSNPSFRERGGRGVPQGRRWRLTSHASIENFANRAPRLFRCRARHQNLELRAGVTSEFFACCTINFLVGPYVLDCVDLLNAPLSTSPSRENLFGGSFEDDDDVEAAAP